MGNTKDSYTQEFRGTDASLGSTIEDLTKKMGRFAESENKVKRHLSGLAADLVNARSGADVLTAGLSRLSESFKVGLGAGVAVGLAAVLKSQTDEITERFKIIGDAQKDVANQASQSDFAKPMEKLKTEAKEAAEQTKRLQGEINKLAGREGFMGLNEMSVRETAFAFASDITGGRVENKFAGAREVLNRGVELSSKREDDIAKEISRREEIAKEENAFKLEEATGPSSMTKSVAIRGELLKLAKEELNLSLKSGVRDDEDIAKKKIILAVQEQKLAELNAEEGLVDRRIKLEEQMSGVRMSSKSAAEKLYELSKLSAEAAQAEADAMKVKNVEQGKLLQLKANEAAKAPGAIDEQLNKGKGTKEIRDRIHEQEKEQRATERFRKKREEAGGLIPTKRNLEGEVIEGIDPVTGEKVKRKVDRFGEELEKRKSKAKRDGKGVEDFIGPKQPEEEKAKAAERENAKKDGKEANKEVVQEIKGLRQDVKDLVNKR